MLRAKELHNINITQQHELSKHSIGGGGSSCKKTTANYCVAIINIYVKYKHNCIRLRDKSLSHVISRSTIHVKE